MPERLRALGEWIEGATIQLFAYFATEWTLLQIAIILVGLALAILLARRFEPVLEAQARHIKGNPNLLRLVAAVLRRLNWVIFVLLLWISRIVLGVFTDPEQTVLLTTALLLAAAWLGIAVLTRIIRNRTLARAVALVAWLYAAVLVFGIEQPVTAGLDAAAITLGTVRLSALMIFRVLIAVTALLWLAMFIGNVLEDRIRRSHDISPSFKVLFSKLIKVVLVVAAGAFALSTTGIDLTALTVFSGAIGVGIGFGLQKVVSNFISGIIILLDRSIKPGDTIELGDTFGWIQDLRARFVSVVTRDGRKYLIPNEDLITQQVVNWSYTDNFVRIDVEFGVAYASDPHRVTEIAIEAARGIARVSTHKAPVCWMTAFGSYALEFKLRFWIVDPQNGLTNVRGQVLLALWDAFKEHGVEIPIPQQEVTLKTPAGRLDRSDGGQEADTRLERK